MHVTVGVRHGRTRRTLAGIVAASVLALSALGGGTALGANPDWSVGHGTLWTAPTASGASSSLVSAGSEVGFYEWLHNGDTSNISQLFLKVTTSPTANVAGALWWIRDSAEIEVGRGSCPTVMPLLCSFGALNSGQTVYVLAVFTVPGTSATGSDQSATFDFNTTGTPPGKNKSHGDAKSITSTVTVADGVDAAGDFNLDQPSLTVSTAPVSSGNEQSTSVTVDGPQVGASVADGPRLTTPCNPTLTSGFPSWFKCSQLSSLTSTLDVGNGKKFDNPNGVGKPGIRGIVSFADAPNQLNGAHPYVYHYWLDASGAHAELITTPCTLSGGYPTNLGPCITVGLDQITVWLLHNGNMRM